MRATGLILMNGDEINLAEKLNLPNRPAPHFVETDVYFHPNAVSFAFLMENGTKIKVIVSGREVFLTYDKKVWEKLKTLLSNKAKAFLVGNYDEIIKAKGNGIDVPLKYVEHEIYFNVNHITFLFLYEKGVKVKIIIAGQDFVLKNEDGLYDKIKTFIE